MNKFIGARKGANDKGFTLVELIVVIVILAILIGVSVSGYSKYIGQSKLNTDIQNAETVRAAVVNAMAENGVYEELAADGSIGKTVVVEITNSGVTVTTAAELKTFGAAICDQLQLTHTDGSVGSPDSKLKTQYKDGDITITATVSSDGATPTAHAIGTCKVVVADKTGKYPSGTFGAAAAAGGGAG